MKIHLTGKYYLTSDSRQFIISTEEIRSAETQETYMKHHKFFTDIPSLLFAFQKNTKLIKSEIINIKEMIDLYNDMKNECKKYLKDIPKLINKELLQDNQLLQEKILKLEKELNNVG